MQSDISSRVDVSSDQQFVVGTTLSMGSSSSSNNNDNSYSNNDYNSNSGSSFNSNGRLQNELLNSQYNQGWSFRRVRNMSLYALSAILRY